MIIARLQGVAAETLNGLDYRMAPDSPNLWLLLGPRWRGANFTAMAEARGVLVSPSESYAILAGATDPAVRLSLTEPNEERLKAGLENLADLLREGPGPLSFRM